MFRKAAFGFACFAIVGCATTHAGFGGGDSAAPVPKITTDEEFGDARADYTALPAQGETRAAWRKALLAYLLPRVRDLLQKNSDDAIEVFRNACSLYEPQDLVHPDAPPEMAQLGIEIAHAYAKRGAEEPVILGLSVASTIDPAQKTKWEERLKWIDEFEASSGQGHRWSKVIEALEGTVRIWPSPEVVDKLGNLYLERHQALLNAIRHGARGGAAEMIENQESGATHTAFKIAALYLRIGDPARAEEALKKVADQPGDDPLLRNLVHHFLQAKQSSEVIDLAKYFIREDVSDREVALRVCQAGAAKFPKDAEPRICAAEMAFTTMAARAPLAIRLLSEATRLAPSERQPAEMLIKLRFLRLQGRLGEDRARVDAAVKEAEDLVKFIEERQNQLGGGKGFEPDASDIYIEVGQGYYNAGAPKEAEDWLKRAIERRPSWKAWHQLGLLRLKHRQFDEAITLFDRALGAPTRSLQEGIELRSTVLRDKADALDRAGKTGEAKAARESALEAWTQMLALVQNPGDAARTQIERGKLMYEVGKKRDAIEAFEKAIDFAPQRPESYADVIAFLVPRGHLTEALDAYHRALGRADISDYVKVYASLWVIDLAADEKAPADPLAEQYLKTVDGARWFDDLARWRSGRISWQQLIGKADTPGKQAEAYFYQAQRLISGGQEGEARELWKKVLSTDMMAFFEFEMADYYLRKGTPRKEPPIPPAERPEKKLVGDAI